MGNRAFAHMADNVAFGPLAVLQRYFLGMALADLTANAVNTAIDEYDKVGGEAFRAKYGFGAAKDYFVIRDGRAYDSKAIAGAAHGYLPGFREGVSWHGPGVT